MENYENTKGYYPKMLTQTLRELEDDKLLHRKVYQEVPPKVEYYLTETGAELIPFIEHLRKWGEKWKSSKLDFIYIHKKPCQGL